MKVNSQTDIPFKSFYTNKGIKKVLEFASDKGALFGATATLGFSLIRPVSIMLTPKTERENREIAMAKSIASSAIGFLLMLVCSYPLSRAINKLDKNPEKYLTHKTIKALKDMDKDIEKSKGYVFAEQMFKLGIGAVVAVPKALLTASGIPYIANIFDDEKRKEDRIDNKKDTNEISNLPVFKASSAEKLAKGLGKIINKNWYQNFVNKYKDTNFPMHIVALTDIIATISFMLKAKSSEKIKDERKPPLVYNSAISTGLSIFGGYCIDKMLEKPTEKFIENFRKANLGQQNLEKQIQGIKIAKPFLILGTIYYIIIPIMSTFLAEKADKNFDKNLKTGIK